MSILEVVPERLIVVFVVLLITFLQLTVNFVIIGPALGGFTSTESLRVLAPLNILLLSIYVNYYLSCTTDPGHVPDEWEPPKAVIEAEELVSMGMPGVRFCKKCDRYKPPRSHHCRYCGKCILKMDHHCPWISNCVGYRNYGYFLRFTYSATLCCAYGCYLLLWRAQRIIDARKINWLGAKPGMEEYILVGVDLMACFLVTLLVGILSLYHTYCVLKGQSTIEASERAKTKQLITRRKIDPVEFPFDVGIYRNLCSVFGSNPLLWFLPLPSHDNGLSFVVKSKTDPRIPYCWPPRDLKSTQPLVDDDTSTHGPRLVRRDSEGYLVKELTMEDRLRMLNGEDVDYHQDEGFDQGYVEYEQGYDQEYDGEYDQEYDDDEYEYQEEYQEEYTLQQTVENLKDE